MTKVQIFATDPSVEDFEEFVLNEARFSFARLDSGGPALLVEGPCWLFIDWMLPEMSGLELCRRLRADPRTAEAHVTMVLEEDDVEDRRRALRAGADDYMLGPITARRCSTGSWRRIRRWAGAPRYRQSGPGA